jgi:LuxR family maltose regulon positive regulatory protein
MQDLPVPIIKTKLYPPPAAPDTVRRERLLSLAQAAAQSPLTLVSAPAGYGKSTLVGQWLQVVDSKFCWLSLDSEESDLTQFLSYVIATLSGLSQDCCGDTVDVLRSEVLPDSGVLAGMFCNDIEALEGPVVLVLDDYHRISSSEVDDFLDAVLEHPPRNLRLILISRRDPALSLHTLRARGCLFDIRMHTLAFTEAETQVFIHGQTDEDFSTQEIRVLHERTEGWPVALRLARLAATASNSAASIVAHLPNDSHAVRTYLMQEVLGNQRPEIREYLLRTAFLDRFCAELCEAVNPESSKGTSGKEFVARLSNANLFTIALDASNNWFRFHHLFQAMLQDLALTSLGREEIRNVHMRASRWFEEHEFLEESIRHALSAENASAAADVIRRHRNLIMNNERWHQLGIWLRLLPPQIVASRPDLLLLKARIFRTRGQNAELMEALDQAESLLDTADLEDGLKRELRGSVASMRCFQFYMESDGERAVQAARRAHDLLPPDDFAERGFAMLLLAAALQMTGDVKGAKGAIHSAMTDKLAHADKGATYITRLLDGLCFIHWMDASLNEVKLAVKDAEEMARQANLWEVLSGILQFKAAVHYHHNELSAVEDDLRDLLCRKAIANPEFYAYSLVISTLTQEALGDSDGALQIAESLHELAIGTHNSYLIGLSEALSAELAIRRGRMADALMWARQYDPEPLMPMYAFFSPPLCLAKILVLDDSTDSRERAQALLPRLEDYLAGIHNKRFLIETLALRALLSEKTGDSALAIEKLGQAISLAQTGGFIRLFVDIGTELIPLLNRLELKGEKLEYVGHILAAFGSEGSRSDAAQADTRTGITIRDIPDLPEHLSPREKEVLALLVKRLTNKEIGEQLFISIATVKRHAHSIYEKLNVKGRHEAVAKAVGLGLISD